MEKAEGKADDIPDGTVTMMSQTEYSDKIETHQSLWQAKSSELTQLTKKLKDVRESKEPLTHVKNTLQEEINNTNKAINTISEEVTHLKHKLRYHSVKQIHGNIERLEYQLRNNNYKPREEQKILDEISMLQRSIKTLQEYEAKQAVNKKYRAERARLIEERNNNFSNIRTLYAQEDDIKKEIAAVRGVISSNKKAIDQLRHIRPKLEQGWIAHQQKLQAARVKRYEEKKRIRQEQTRERQEERRKLWEEYEASKEPYEEEKNLCQVLISYLQSSLGSSTPSTPASSTAKFLSPSTPNQKPVATVSTPELKVTQDSPCCTSSETLFTSQCTSPTTPTESRSSTSLMLPPDSSGSFYSKPRDDEEGFIKVSKRGKAKAKRERRLANRVKELPHTPDVLMKFSKLSLLPPKTTDEVSAAIVSLQDCLQHFHTLSLSERNQIQKEEKSEDTNKVDTSKCLRPTSLSVKGNSCPTETTKQRELSSQVGCSKSAMLERSSLASSPIDLQNLNSSNAIPVVSVVSSVVSWAAPVAPEQFSRNDMEVNPSLLGATKQNTVFTSMGCSTPAVLERSSPAPPLLDDLHLTRPSTVTVSVASVVSPVISWATAVVPEQYSGNDISQNLNQMTANTQENQLLYNGVHPSISRRVRLDHITHEINSAPVITSEMKLCNDIISPGNNESFFSMPVSYPSNLVELNNNAGCSYAAVVAKVKPGAVNF